MTDQVHVHDDDVISSDEAEAVNVVAQRGRVRHERGHPDTVSNPERGNRRLALQRQLPVKGDQGLTEDGMGLGLAGCLTAHQVRPTSQAL